jgi:hypothetical protein
MLGNLSADATDRLTRVRAGPASAAILCGVYHFLQTAIDDAHSRLAYSELLTGERQGNRRSFPEATQCLPSSERLAVQNILTDNGFC